jgi:hypothetical protein
MLSYHIHTSTLEATVQRTEEILILDRRSILEHGPRADMANDPNSHFCQLLQNEIKEVLA